jgi:hypothetical protein
MKSQLVEFTRDALAKGANRTDIADALRGAGWSDADVRAALSAFSETTFPVPVPRPAPSLSARETFVYLVVFTAFYASVWSLISVIFDFIELWFPDPLVSLSRIGSFLTDSIRFYTSWLIIAFPLFLLTFLATRRAIASDPSKRNSGPRKWLTYLTLFLAVCSIAGSLVGLIYNVLGGELTIRFALKALTVLLIAGGTLGYFLSDIRKEENP